MKPWIILTFFSVIYLFQPLFLQAQQDPTPSKWMVRLEPYILFPSMKGDIAVGRLPTMQVDQSFSEIMEELKFAGMLNVEVYNHKWRFISDVLYMNLRKPVKPNVLIADGGLNTKQLGWQLAGYYRITPWFEAGAGILINNVDISGDITLRLPTGGTLSESIGRKQGWVDPLIVTRFATPEDKKWYAIGRADIGGFGIGSNLAWQVMGIGGYRVSKLFDVSAGYRAISLDYETDKDTRFLYDMVIAGPMLRFGFTF